MRVRHDDSSITTVDGVVVERGATNQKAVRCPGTAGIETGSVIRVVLDDATYYATFIDRGTDSVVVTGAYAMPGQARDPGGADDQLRPWIEGKGLAPGRTVHVDVVAPEYLVGLRAPGESATYDAGQPDGSLRDIARDR